MHRAAVLAATALALIGLLAVTRAQTSGGSASAPSAEPSRDVATEAEARAVCGTACHAFPPPDLLPSASWRETVARMTLIMQGQSEPLGPPGTAARMVPLSSDMQRVLRFYQQHAPERLPPPTPWPAADSGQFTRRQFAPPDAPPGPAISHVRLLDLDGDGLLEIVAADMRFGYLLAGWPSRPGGRLDVIGHASNPARFELFDWDGDGIQDLLVGDLGRFLPEDHEDGAIVWMRGAPRLQFSRLFLSGWPRVADVRPGDFNGDGKPDLVVAAFGWRKVGKVVVLENRTTDYSRPELVPHVVDDRPGAIHVIPADLNGDDRLDFVALISQQFETVVAYINTGDFTFRRETIYVAPHPNWGSSGIELVDFDGDGDLDVVLAHGDTFDDSLIKPYHGIQWLENRGGYPFVPHDLADLPGAFGIRTGDLTGNGLLDIVACAFIAGGSNVDESDMPAIVWLEQVRRGVFERRTLKRAPPRHATIDLADVDADGDLDIVVGTFATAPDPNAPWVELWENQGSGKAQGARLKAQGARLRSTP